MAEEEQERIGSPYHEKCFPPYCDDASPHTDKAVISKMDRDDLEDKYIVYADENLTLKKQIRNHERHIQRLQTALARQDSADKRGGARVPASIRYDNNRADSLESQNKHLQAKINVLRQQLMNHSYIHSKENRIAENKGRLPKREQISPDLSAREPKQRYSFRDDSLYGKDGSTSALKERIAALEQLIETEKEKYKARIAKLEKELAAAKRSEKNLNAEISEHSRRVSDNLEMIRLQRQSQEQATKLSLLSDKYEAAERELTELRAALKQATENAEELKELLEREREKAREAQTHITKSVSHTETIRALEEQIRDLKNENETLKDTNEKLLLLTSGSQGKSGNESKLRNQISTLELKLKEKIKELEEKEEQLIKLESLMEETGRKTPHSASESPSRNELIRENERLRQQLEAVDADGGKEECEMMLEKAQQELKVLRRIAEEHEYCPKTTLTPVASEIERKISTPKSQKSISHHKVKEVMICEPAQKPALVIVSKHEFEAVLLKKKQYKSKTEVVTPASGKEVFNCKLEICVYDLEIDKQMVENLRDMDRDPKVFVEWNFVGLKQRTVSMPVAQARFCTNVAYFGPLSDNVADYVKERELPVQIWLEKSNGDAAKVASGNLDLSPAMQSPSRAFIRSIHLQGHQGKATVHCAFKLHECCRSDSGSPAEETLEVSIGHLKLKKSNIAPDAEATHLYIEYSLLGRGGPELETDSVPRAEVMQFNYNKRLMVNEENANYLMPLLEEDNPKSLRFLLLTEPCDLGQTTEVEEIGHADLNLVEEMLKKNRDAVSVQLPVFDKERDHIGSLSVTVIGVDTIKNYAKSRQ